MTDKNYIINLGETDRYRFRLRDFALMQKKIYDKFDTKTSYMQNINNYFLHIMEEVYEVQISINKEEEKEELIDVLMYLGSTLNCFNNIDIELMPNMIEVDINDVTNNDVISQTNTIVHSLLSIRRNFAERKWHKPYDPSQIDYKLRDSLVEISLIDLIKRVIILLVSNNNYLEVNSSLNKKQKFISNLPRI